MIVGFISGWLLWLLVVARYLVYMWSIRPDGMRNRIRIQDQKIGQEHINADGVRYRIPDQFDIEAMQEVEEILRERTL
jgi:hypothetical protein